jgi:hypothetical protein
MLRNGANILHENTLADVAASASTLSNLELLAFLIVTTIRVVVWMCTRWSSTPLVHVPNFVLCHAWAFPSTITRNRSYRKGPSFPPTHLTWYQAFLFPPSYRRCRRCSPPPPPSHLPRQTTTILSLPSTNSPQNPTQNPTLQPSISALSPKTLDRHLRNHVYTVLVLLCCKLRRHSTGHEAHTQ